MCLTGCDLVFGLRGRADPDAAIVDVTIDQPIDAAETGCMQDPSRTDDEDGDEFPNSCDNCPHVAQADQLDSDNDGVGNACDPRPFAVDTIDYFDGFDSLPLGLDLLPANRWKIENGRLVAFGVPYGTDALARLRHSVGDAQIITRLTLLVSDGDPESAGVWARLGSLAGTPEQYPPGVLFEVLRNTAGAVRRCQITETWQYARVAIECAQNAALFQTGRAYTMSLDCVEGQEPECRGVIAYDTSEGHTEIPIDWPEATRAMGPVGLRVYAVDAAFDYMVVISHE